MLIQCPACGKDNDLKLEKTVNCGKCKEELSGHTYLKPLVSKKYVFFAGIGAFFAVDRYILDEPRYPLEVEYAIVEHCVSANDKAIGKNAFSRLRDLCICQLEETMKALSYSEYKDDQSRFDSVFGKVNQECR